VVASIWNWILTLLFGTGAAITQGPVNLPAGETFFRAARVLTPVDDTMVAGIDLGKATEEKKREILSRTLNVSDIGNIKVQFCKSQTECVPMTHSGLYFSQDSYGIRFDASGPQLKHGNFVGVKISVVRPLDSITINWSNYSQ
jgi:hypothetical protein